MPQVAEDMEMKGVAFTYGALCFGVVDDRKGTALSAST